MRLIIPLAMVLIGITGYGIYAYSLRIPKIIEQKTTDFFTKAGFDQPIYQAPSIGSTKTEIKYIKFDPEGLSTLDRLDLEYSLPSLLFQKKISKASAEKLTLIGEIKDDGTFDFAGWHAQNLYLEMPLQKLIVRGGRVGVLTPLWGGLNFDFDLEARNKGRYGALQGGLKSQQQHMSFVSNFEGRLNEDRSLELNFKIETAKINADRFKITRLNGQGELSVRPDSSASIHGNFQAGGVNILGFPWQNAKGEFNASLNGYDFRLNATSLGVEGLRLDFIRDHKGHIKGQIKTQKGKDLFDYLKIAPERLKKDITLTDEVIMAFESNDQLNFNYSFEGTTIEGRFEIKDKKIIFKN